MNELQGCYFFSLNFQLTKIQCDNPPTFMDHNAPAADPRKVQFETPPISRLTLGKSPFPKRKFSFPAVLHSNLLTVPSSEPPGPNLSRRRFSNVGDVVSRKLSNTIWRTQSVPTEEVIAQGRVLCGQYIRNRLKRSGIFGKKLGLYRLRSVVGASSTVVVREVFPGLACAGAELERMYPKLYSNVARQSSHSPGGVLVSDKSAGALLAAIGHDLFKSEITWGKVVSIFAVSGGLAVDCVCQGHPEYMHGLMEGMVEVLEDDLGEWVASNGGWTALSNQCRLEEEEVSFMGYTSTVMLALALLFIAYLIIRFFGKFVFL